MRGLVLGILTVAMTSIHASADCKWFKVGGFEFGGPVPVVTSSNPGCFSVNAQSAFVGADGSVAFQLCNVSTPIACAGCGGDDVFIAITMPTGPARHLRVRCQGCGTPFICCGYPTVDGCIGNICTTSDGDSIGTAIDVTGCVYPLDEEQCALEVPAFLTNSDAEDDDLFGVSVAIDGDVAVIGASAEDEAGDNCGSAYVFRRIGGIWIEEDKLFPSDGYAGRSFAGGGGGAVSIDGDTILLSDHWDDAANPTVSFCDSGSAYVFRFDGVNWAEEGKLIASDSACLDDFGWCGAISGDIAVIGERFDDNPLVDAGSAYVFERTGTTWSQVAKLIPSDTATGDWFGNSVAVDGDTIVVGCSKENREENNMGSAYVFDRPAGGWVDMTETAKLTASDAAFNEEFGRSVSIDGDVIVAGAIRDNQHGSAYIFVKPPSGWTDMTQTAKLTASDADADDYVGTSVSIDGDAVAVSAWRDLGNGVDPGSAYLFFKPPGGWANMTESAQFDTVGLAAADWLGYTIAISGQTAIVGALFDNHSDLEAAGAAHIFTGLGAPDCDGNGIGDGCDILNNPAIDANGNGVIDSCEPPCPADTNGDLVVDVADLLALLSAWGPCDVPCPPNCAEDTNDDCIVNVQDLLNLLAAWGPCPG